jgi:hypothetical protein
MPKRKSGSNADSNPKGKRANGSTSTSTFKTAAESVYAVPEIRQRILSFLDRVTLTSFIRVEKPPVGMWRRSFTRRCRISIC